MTEQEYNQALDQTHISGGEQWNQRYLEALAACGLQLVPWGQDDPGYYIEAPLPMPNQSPSWGRSLIVPSK
jgi:hypothetical protein